jgi:hypothetical protein
MNEQQKKVVKETMDALDEEFGATKSYEWKAAICHFVIHYDNMEGKQLKRG